MNKCQANQEAHKQVEKPSKNEVKSMSGEEIRVNEAEKAKWSVQKQLLGVTLYKSDSVCLQLYENSNSYDVC